MDKTAVVILNWNGLDWLKKLLGNVAANTITADCSLWVADNGSKDGSMDWVKEHFPQVKLLDLESNHGFAEGYNRALNQIEASYYILINSDVEVTPGWAAELTGFMDKHPEAAAAQPKILSLWQRDHFEYAGAAGGFIDYLGYPFCRGRLFNINEKDEGQYDNVTEVFWTSGACMIIRAEAWKRCKGLDPLFFAHMEEIDLCWRLLLSGYKLYYNPCPVVYHAGGGALPYNSPFKTYLNFRNNLFMLYKNLPSDKLGGILLKRRFMDGLSAVFFLMKGQFRNIGSIWKAHMDFYRNLGVMKQRRNDIERLTPENPGRLIMNKSLVFEFYIKGKHTSNRLNTIFLSKHET